MKKTKYLMLLGLELGLLAGGCPQIPPPTAKSVDFNDFVVEQLGQTADDAQPVNIDDVEFKFDENAGTFNGLFS